MKTLAPGDTVRVYAQGAGEIVGCDATVVALRMEPGLAGLRGEMAVDVDLAQGWIAERVVHRSHASWHEGRALLAYAEGREGRPRMGTRATLTVNGRSWDELPRRLELPCGGCGEPTRGRMDAKLLCMGCALGELLRPLAVVAAGMRRQQAAKR